MSLIRTFGFIFVIMNFSIHVNAEIRSARLKRLDPHGTAETPHDLKTFHTQSDCKICHIEKNGKVLVHNSIQNVCLSCHGKDPHSGASEHLAKKVTCLECHTPHRAVTTTKTNENKQFSPTHSWSLSPELTERKHANPRIRKDCTECHRWK